MGFELKGISKLGDKERLDELISYIKIQLDDEDDSLALMANISAFIMAILKDLNWAGFYLVDEDDLVLGPFQGLPACTRLAFDKGVVAKSYRLDEIIKVDNVHDFDSHIACDSSSMSELVVPIKRNGEIICLIDLDSPIESRFTDIDVEGFKKIAELMNNRI